MAHNTYQLWRCSRCVRKCALLIALASICGAATADDDDALQLQSAALDPESGVASTSKALRMLVEAGAGHATERFGGSGSSAVSRLSLDLAYATKLGGAWRLVLSDRLEYQSPVEPDRSQTLNSLREAYLSWSGTGGESVIDAGRINMRFGPAYGYNPTDMFRDGALRAVTTSNPFSLRENRMGTVALRLQRLWADGSLSLVLSPKLSDASSGSTWSLDLGATNHRDRALLGWSQRWGERFSSQVLLLADRDEGLQAGTNFSGLLGDSWVVFGEWAAARERLLADKLLGTTQAAKVFGQRASLGFTFTSSTKLNITLEGELNSFAMPLSQWQALAVTQPQLLAAYALQAGRLQDLAMRTAALLYVNQSDFLARNLDLTALVRYNAVDHSRILWAEMRYRFKFNDIAVQFQSNSGRDGTQYGSLPAKNITQFLANFHY